MIELHLYTFDFSVKTSFNANALIHVVFFFNVNAYIHVFLKLSFFVYPRIRRIYKCCL